MARSKRIHKQKIKYSKEDPLTLTGSYEHLSVMFDISVYSRHCQNEYGIKIDTKQHNGHVDTISAVLEDFKKEPEYIREILPSLNKVLDLAHFLAENHYEYMLSERTVHGVKSSYTHRSTLKELTGDEKILKVIANVDQSDMLSGGIKSSFVSFVIDYIA